MWLPASATELCPKAAGRLAVLDAHGPRRSHDAGADVAVARSTAEPTAGTAVAKSGVRSDAGSFVGAVLSDTYLLQSCFAGSLAGLHWAADRGIPFGSLSTTPLSEKVIERLFVHHQPARDGAWPDVAGTASTWKCRCTPVDHPVEPASAMCWP